MVLSCSILVFISCDNSLINRPISKHLLVQLQPDKSGLVFGGPPYFTATLKEARSECIPYKRTTDKETKSDPNEFFYKLVITTDIGTALKDPIRLPGTPLRGKMRFDAVTPSNVVLGSTEITVQFTPGLGSEQVTAVIYGLNSYEIDRISNIHAFWLTGY
jgi:hypothetical protein